MIHLVWKLKPNRFTPYQPYYLKSMPTFQEWSLALKSSYHSFYAVSLLHLYCLYISKLYTCNTFGLRLTKFQALNFCCTVCTYLSHLPFYDKIAIAILDKEYQLLCLASYSCCSCFCYFLFLKSKFSPYYLLLKHHFSMLFILIDRPT